MVCYWRHFYFSFPFFSLLSSGLILVYLKFKFVLSFQIGSHFFIAIFSSPSFCEIFFFQIHPLIQNFKLYSYCFFKFDPYFFIAIFYFGTFRKIEFFFDFILHSKTISCPLTNDLFQIWLSFF